MDLEELKRQKYRKERERDNLNAEIGRLQRRLNILDKAYNQLSDAKTKYLRLRQSSDDAQKRVEYWRGNNYTAFTQAYAEITSGNTAGYKQLDRIHDDLNRKLNKLYNEIGEKQGLLQGIIRKIGYLTTEIQNWFNN